MKHKIKNFGIASLCVVTLLAARHASAIEGLQIAVHGPNVVLSWPSIPAETYIVQYTPDLLVPWGCLTNSLPANQSGGMTTFTHSGIVNYPPPPTGVGTSGSPPSPDDERRGGEIPTPYDNDAGVRIPPAIPGFKAFPIAFPTENSQDTDDGSEVHTKAITADDVYTGGGSLQGTIGFYQVVRVGVHVGGLTNGMSLSGTVTFPVEIGWTNSDLNGNASFMGMTATLYDPASGPVQLGGSALQNNSGNLQWLWNTTLSASSINPTQGTIQGNGLYTINFTADFQDASTVTNNPITVAVANMISFPSPFASIFGSQMWINAQLAVQNASWDIDVFDANTNYIGSFMGTTTNGAISRLWNLLDTSGNYYGGSNIQGNFFVTPLNPQTPNAQPASLSAPSSKLRAQPQASGSGTYSAPFQWRPETTFFLDQYAVAWADLLSPATPQGGPTVVAQGTIMQGVVNTLANPANSLRACLKTAQK